MQGATWISAAVVVFVLKPPGHSVEATSSAISWSALARFNVAVLNGLALLAAISFGRREYLRYWVALSAGGTVAGSLMLGVYGYAVTSWTCEIASGDRLVIGTTLTAKAEAYSKKDDCKDLLDGFASDPLRVWRRHEVFQREMILGWLFTFAVAFFGTGLIALLQAYKIARQKTAPPRRAGRREA